MAILRIGVILWLCLPLIILAISRYWQTHRTSHYPTAGTARVVEVEYSKGFLNSAGSTRLTYAYRVMGVDYEAQGLLDGMKHKAGEEVPIRYNPRQPGQSIVWEPMKRSDWLTLALMWLSLCFGTAIFCIFLSLYLLVMVIGYRRQVKRNQTDQAGLTTGMVLILGFAISLLLLVGVSALLKDGFWGQNWLVSLWNLAFSINWKTVVDVAEGVVFSIAFAVMGGIFSLLRKKMNPWLAFLIILVIFSAIIFCGVSLKVDYIEPLLTPQG